LKGEESIQICCTIHIDDSLNFTSMKREFAG
jgi:hypothetical protein